MVKELLIKGSTSKAGVGWRVAVNHLPKGKRFDSSASQIHRGIAQLVEHEVLILVVDGSSPSTS